FWEGNPNAPEMPGRTTMVPPPSGVVLRMTKAQDWKPLLNQLLGPLREQRHSGLAYFTAAGPAEGWGAFPADEQTLVVAQADLLRELIEDRNGPVANHTWDEPWRNVPRGQVALAVDMRWVRRRLGQAVGGAPAAPGQPPAGDLKLETIAPLIEKTQAYALAF